MKPPIFATGRSMVEVVSGVGRNNEAPTWLEADDLFLDEKDIKSWVI